MRACSGGAGRKRIAAPNNAVNSEPPAARDLVLLDVTGGGPVTASVGAAQQRLLGRRPMDAAFLFFAVDGES